LEEMSDKVEHPLTLMVRLRTVNSKTWLDRQCLHKLKCERASAMRLDLPKICRTHKSCLPSSRILMATLRIQLYSGRAHKELNMATVVRLSVKITILLHEGQVRCALQRADKTAKAS